MIDAEPRPVAGPADCDFYHSIDLPTYGHQAGVWDLRGRFDDYTGGVTLDGRTLLDVGTATGFLTFEAERRGAYVTSFDVDSVDRYAELPIRDAEFVRDHAAWRERVGTMLDRMKNSYWLCHRDLGSRARCVYGDVYALDPSVGRFDVVLVGQILIHLRDGIGALAAAASVCTDTIIVTEGSFEDDYPVATLAGRADKPDVAYAWYQYSTGWYREVLAMLGFSTFAFTTGRYACNQDAHEREIELTTIVASRAAIRRRRRGLLSRRLLLGRVR